MARTKGIAAGLWGNGAPTAWRLCKGAQGPGIDRGRASSVRGLARRIEVAKAPLRRSGGTTLTGGRLILRAAAIVVRDGPIRGGTAPVRRAMAQGDLVCDQSQGNKSLSKKILGNKIRGNKIRGNKRPVTRMPEPGGCLPPADRLMHRVENDGGRAGASAGGRAQPADARGY